MDQDSVILFTRFGLGDAPSDLQKTLVTKFLSLTLESGKLPAKILFYTEGVKLTCEGSPVLEQLKQLEQKGVELVICHTCVNYFSIADQVRVGVVGGMGDILTVLQQAKQVISV